MGRFFCSYYGFKYVKFDGRHDVAIGSSRYHFLGTAIDAMESVCIGERSRVKSVRVSDTPKRERGGLEPRLYTMNRAKFRSKVFAYSLLSRSLRFLAFYTVSFPEGLPDEVCAKVWNTILTRWRQELGLKSYIWVVERQKNGTMHYHMLTNDFMRVYTANRYAAICIDTEIRKRGLSWGNSSLDRYNGVDVKRVNSTKMSARKLSPERILYRVSKYLSKYMSKEYRSEPYRLWHCSRLVSALVVQAVVEEADVRELVEENESRGVPVKVVEGELCSFIFTAVISRPYYQDTVCRLNDAIYTYFETHNLFYSPIKNKKHGNGSNQDVVSVAAGRLVSDE